MITGLRLCNKKVDRLDRLGENYHLFLWTTQPKKKRQNKTKNKTQTTTKKSIFCKSLAGEIMRHLRMGNAIQWNHLKPSLATSATSDTVVEALTMLITDVKANCSWSDC